MKNIKKHLSLVLTTICLMVGGGCGAQQTQGSDVKKKTYEVINVNTQYVRSEHREPLPVYSLSYDCIGGRDVMPIGGWWGPYNNDSQAAINGQMYENFITDKYFKLLSDCGINTITVAPCDYYTQKAGVQKSLELSAKYNMAYYVLDSAVTTEDDDEKLKENLQEYLNHPNCAGAHFIDEPGVEKFDWIAEYYERFYSFGFENKYLWTNMLPIGGKYSSSGKNVPYEEYIATYLDSVKPAFLSVDHYIFKQPDQGNANMVNYFKSLSILRRLTQEREIPFFYLLQAGDQWGSRDIGIYPSESELIWNVNTVLAYGAKGFGYYCLIQPVSYTNLSDTDRIFNNSGLIGAAGNVNRWYYYAQKVNKQVAACDHVLMNATSCGLMGVGTLFNSNVTVGEDVLESFRELKSIDAKEALVGCFDYNGKTALWVVNNSVTEKQNITLNFDAKYGYEVTQRAQRIDIAAETFTLTLEAGEAVLVVLK